MCHEMSCFVMRGPCDVMRCHEVRHAASCRAPLRKPRSGSAGGSAGGRDGGPAPMCHEMSCFVMRPAASLSASLAEAPLSLSCMSSLHRVSFRSRRPRFPGKRPFFARIACAPAPAFAPARFARLIARARANARRTSPVRSVGVFSHRREAEGETARGRRFLLSHPTTDSTGSSPFGNYFINDERRAASGHRPFLSAAAISPHSPRERPGERRQAKRGRWRPRDREETCIGPASDTQGVA